MKNYQVDIDSRTHRIRQFLKAAPTEKIHLVDRVPIDFGSMSRSLAKIAHAYTVAQIGYDRFEPLLLDIIHGRGSNTADLIGGSLPGQSLSQLPDTLHAMVLDFISGGDDRLLLTVRIKLFCFLDAPTYQVVTGWGHPGDTFADQIQPAVEIE